MIRHLARISVPTVVVLAGYLVWAVADARWRDWWMARRSRAADAYEDGGWS